MMSRSGPLFALVGIVALAASPGWAKQRPDAVDLAQQLAQVGPRSPGSPGHRTGQDLLLQAMTVAGLQTAQRMPLAGVQEWSHLTGVLPGRASTEWVLSAHHDTVAGSRGALDNASGCAAIVGAASALSRAPRHHTVRIMLTDGEESDAAGTRDWLAELSEETRRALLGNLNVDMVGLHEGPAIVHIIAAGAGDTRVVSPAWLVHALLESARASGVATKVLDERWSWFAQLSVRCTRPTRFSDGRRFLEAGVPSVTLSDWPLTAPRGHHSGVDGDRIRLDSERLDDWIRLLATTTRRLDQLADRPLGDGEYLVVAGRVWIRRDLVWCGFILWVLLVWRGLPGSWRQRGAEDRRRVGRSYLPGFSFRMIFLVAVFLIPTFATLLLFPVALLSLAGRARRFGVQRLVCALAMLPTLAFVLWLTVGQMAGWFVLDRTAFLPAALVLITLATFCTWQLDPSSIGTGAAELRGPKESN